MDLKLKDKIAIVTGAGGQTGYGKKIATTLAEEGCHIVVADIDFVGAQNTAGQIEAMGRNALAVKVDISDRAQVDEMVKAAVDRFGRIDILVNNAGTSSREKPFLQMTRADWDLDIDVNLIGQMNCAQAVIPQMIEQKYGRVINTTGGRGIPGISVYGAAKAGIVAWTHSIAGEVAQFGVIVNGISPGLGDTGLTKNAPPGFKDINTQRSMLKRLCTPDDVAPTVAFLASDLCSYMTGQFIDLSTF
jgi:NAD(P)-dependent dehydrogenase (short-subunit alcohol dehydrogenase family)